LIIYDFKCDDCPASKRIFVKTAKDIPMMQQWQMAFSVHAIEKKHTVTHKQDTRLTFNV